MPTVLLNIEPTDDADYVRVLPDEVAAGARRRAACSWTAGTGAST
jgi:hypothetical protein